MHRSSILKATAFRDTYVAPCAQELGHVSILDIGSKSYESQKSHKHLFDDNRMEYVGLDLEPGPNVDLVPRDSFIWTEFSEERFDFCISGQTFEHNPYFWVTFAEIARVLKQGGLVQIVAPGRGAVHRFPLDCWRFYPDSWLALCHYCGLELVESYFEDYAFSQVVAGSEWCDSMLIAKKPVFPDEGAALAYYDRLARIRQTLQGVPPIVPRADSPHGQCVLHYQSMTRTSTFKSLLKRLRPSALKRRLFLYY